MSNKRPSTLNNTPCVVPRLYRGNMTNIWSSQSASMTLLDVLGVGHWKHWKGLSMLEVVVLNALSWQA